MEGARAVYPAADRTISTTEKTKGTAFPVQFDLVNWYRLVFSVLLVPSFTWKVEWPSISFPLTEDTRISSLFRKRALFTMNRALLPALPEKVRPHRGPDGSSSALG